MLTNGPKIPSGFSFDSLVEKSSDFGAVTAVNPVDDTTMTIGNDQSNATTTRLKDATANDTKSNNPFLAADEGSGEG